MSTLRLLPFAALALLTPAALPAQEPGPGTAVERVTLRPGDEASFTLAPGKDHQLLSAAPSSAKGAITIRYAITPAGGSQVVATSHAGVDMTFTVLADPDGPGPQGFAPAGDVPLPGNGSTVTRNWPNALGVINVGDFVGGPHGDHPHVASGD